ncbi:hypothetical protein [Streptomyces sp. LUP47B]|uniref:hypothetical protein n=1 Tax=Streptomyces sp. LUP47B TaxID=1890286 RepID=UPI000851A018|nr:hypothetical protein [Streptomyces sp. LUP47B]
MNKGDIFDCLPKGPDPTFHLVHRSPSWDHFAVDAPSRGDEHFSVSGELLSGSGPAGDHGGHFHDWQFLTVLVRETGSFIGYQHFGIPPYLPAQFSLFELELHDPATWRADGNRPSVTVDLHVRPSGAPDGSPHRLEITGTVLLNDLPGARIRAALGFLVPMPVHAPDPPGPTVAVRPSEVGRVSQETVLLGTPVLSAYGRLTSPVLIPRDVPGLGAAPNGSVPDLALTEVVRQASLLCARLTCGLHPRRSTTTALSVRRRGSMIAGAALDCTAVPGRLGVDEHGYPRVPMVLTIHQNGRAVVEATSEVHQDF